MYLRLAILFFFSCIKTTVAQPFAITLKTNDTLFSTNVIIHHKFYQGTKVVYINGMKFHLEKIDQIYDQSSSTIYKTIQFRRHLCLARQLESGTISLYDFQIPEGRQRTKLKRISTNNRFYFHEFNDTILRPLNKHHFEKIFDRSIGPKYPKYAIIKKQYLQLHTTGIISAIMLPNLITAAGFQSVVFFIPYVAATSYATGITLIKRQEKLNHVREMIRKYNQSF